MIHQLYSTTLFNRFFPDSALPGWLLASYQCHVGKPFFSLLYEKKDNFLVASFFLLLS